MNLKKRILLNIPYGIIVLLAAKLSEGWRLAVGANASEKTLKGSQRLLRLGFLYYRPYPQKAGIFGTYHQF